MKTAMSLSPRCAARSRRSRALISLNGHHVLVESCVHDLGSCATPIVLERGGEGVLNHANTVSVEDNLRKRSYSHIPQTEQLRRQPAYMRGVGTTEVLEL
jgi:hypothetical protein